MSGTMSKYRREIRGAGTSGHENSSCAVTSGSEFESGVGTSGPVNSCVAGVSGPQNSRGTCTIFPGKNSDANISGFEKSSGAGTSGHEVNNYAGTSGHEVNNYAGTSGHEVNNYAGTSGHEVNNYAGTSGYKINSGAYNGGHENRCVAGASGPENNRGAATRSSENSCVASTSGYVNSTCTGTSGPVSSNGTGTSCSEDTCGAGISGSENSSCAGTSGSENSRCAGTSGSGNSNYEVTRTSVPEPIPPMSDSANWFIEKRIDDIANKYNFDPAERGKWVLRFAIDQMNEMWAKVCRLYTEGKLAGIQFIRTSTAKDLRRDGGAIRFYCGPSSNEELVKNYGQSVVRLMKYSKQCGFISFKTDEQVKKGTRWTYLYLLEVPRTERGCQDECNEEHEIDILRPMSITDRGYAPETIVGIHDRYKYDWTLRGRWTMRCRADTLDDAWREACTLYRQGKLTGVQSMGVMTGMKQPSDPKPIFFHCGPCSNRDLMMEYGRGIAEHLGNFCSGTRLGYKVSVLVDKTQTSLSKQLEKSKYLYTLNIRR